MVDEFTVSGGRLQPEFFFTGAGAPNFRKSRIPKKTQKQPKTSKNITYEKNLVLVVLHECEPERGGGSRVFRTEVDLGQNVKNTRPKHHIRVAILIKRV